MTGKRALRGRKGTKYIVGMVLATLLLTPSVLGGLVEKPQAKTAEPPAPQPVEMTAPVGESAPTAPPSSVMPELPVEPAAQDAQTAEAGAVDGASNAAAEDGGADTTGAAAEQPVSFENAVFLGDSRTEGFYLYSGLTTGQFLYAQGATVESVFTKATVETEGENIPMMDALDAMEFSEVYIMLGVNELGWPLSQTFYEQYGKVIDRIRETHPDAEIFLQSILPVSAKPRAKRGNYVNNARIAEYNTLLRTLAEEKSCTYLDVASAVSDEAGCLPDRYSYDGVHLNTAGCKQWLEYLEQQLV